MEECVLRKCFVNHLTWKREFRATLLPMLKRFREYLRNFRATHYDKIAQLTRHSLVVGESEKGHDGIYKSVKTIKPILRKGKNVGLHRKLDPRNVSQNKKASMRGGWGGQTKTYCSAVQRNKKTYHKYCKKPRIFTKRTITNHITDIGRNVWRPSETASADRRPYLLDSNFFTLRVFWNFFQIAITFWFAQPSSSFFCDGIRENPPYPIEQKKEEDIFGNNGTPTVLHPRWSKTNNSISKQELKQQPTREGKKFSTPPDD